MMAIEIVYSEALPDKVERLEREIAALVHELGSPSRSAQAYAQWQLPVLEAQLAEARTRLMFAEVDLLVPA